MAFDGSGDYVSVPNETFHFGTEDFTIEFWIYHTGTTGYQTPFDNGYATTTGSIALQTDLSNLNYKVFAGTSSVFQESVNPSTNTWYHIALVRNNGTLTLYRDGTSTGTISNTNNFNYSGSKVAAIGAGHSTSGAGDHSVQGYISDFRITKGLARYTANFTPPTAALRG